jgi:hypothetical protein
MPTLRHLPCSTYPVAPAPRYLPRSTYPVGQTGVYLGYHLISNRRPDENDTQTYRRRVDTDLRSPPPQLIISNRRAITIPRTGHGYPYTYPTASRPETGITQREAHAVAAPPPAPAHTACPDLPAYPTGVRAQRTAPARPTLEPPQRTPTLHATHTMHTPTLQAPRPAGRARAAPQPARTLHQRGTPGRHSRPSPALPAYPTHPPGRPLEAAPGSTDVLPPRPQQPLLRPNPRRGAP